ncbi:hypothetical protein RYX36_023932 [Vicia faba]
MASTNGKLINHIHEDVAFSILSKLPLKSLWRFACVCKSWSFLFENSHFMDMVRNNFLASHSEYNDTCHVLRYFLPTDMYDRFWYLCYGKGFETKVELDLPSFCKDSGHDYLILGSSINGLLCLYDIVGKIVLWNPDSDKSEVIPLSLVESSLPYNEIKECVNFTPCGFGYDHVGNDYKVIRHVTYLSKYFTHFKIDRQRSNYSWEIYSLRNNSWRNLEIDAPVRDISVSRTCSEVYLNGVCHWLGGTYDKCVVSFNLTNEILCTTSFSLDMCKRYDFLWWERHILVLNESIALISNHLKKIEYFQIFILGEFGVKESWIKLFNIGPLQYIFRPIGVGYKGDIIFAKRNRTLICFDLNTQVIKEIDIQVNISIGCQIARYEKYSFLLKK